MNTYIHTYNININLSYFYNNEYKQKDRIHRSVRVIEGFQTTVKRVKVYFSLSLKNCLDRTH